MGTPYHFRISLTDSHGQEYKMNVRSDCTAYATCTSGSTIETGEDVTSWEAVTTYGTSPSDTNPPPTQVWVEIHRATPQLTCDTFEVALYNY
jgi:hypothetical protein